MRRIFLCDDTNEYRALVRTVLDAEDDIEVVGEAADGCGCVRNVAETGADLVLLDLNMPGLHGLDTLPHLRRIVPDADIVVLTTDSEAESEVVARERGARGFIRKPRDVFDLPDAVRASVAA